MTSLRERDGRRFYPAFYATCTHNTGLTPTFFGKAALESASTPRMAPLSGALAGQPGAAALLRPTLRPRQRP